MKQLVLLASIFILSSALGQNGNFKKTIIKDSIKQIQIYSPDSLIINMKIYTYNSEKKLYDLFQSVSYDTSGKIISFYSYYGKEWNSENQLELDQIVIDLNDAGKPEKVFFTNEFKLFRGYVFNKTKNKYKRYRLKRK